MATFKKILCPTDFSEASYEGLKKAVDLAQRSETEICVVYVDQPLQSVTPLAGIVPEAEDESSRRAEAVWNLRDVLAERLPSGVRTQPLLRTGDAATEIVRAAREEGCDLIVLTTHGACGWREGVLGSVAEEVLRHAPCPVLTVSGPASGNPYAVNDKLLRRTTGAMRPELAVSSNHKLYLDGD